MDIMDKEVSFEELLKLREKVGLKSFKEFESEVIFKNKAESKKKRSINGQNDDDGPIEISSKTPFKRPKAARKNIHKFNGPRTRDPRFDNRIGKFNEEKFKKNFRHAFELRDQEIEELKSSHKKDEEDIEESKKYLIQRVENQKRESSKKINKSNNSNNKVEILSDGNKFYKTKKLQRTEELVSKFIELKNNGKLEKHLDKRRKKLSGKERKKMNIEK